MSLADELLADLEEIGDGLDDEFDVGHQDDDIEEVGMDDNEIEIRDTVRNIAKLRDSDRLSETMLLIEHYQSNPQTRDQIIGPMESHPEYRLIVEANNLTVEIDSEINIIHKFVKDRYSTRFPELNQLVPTSLEYLLTVNAIGNDVELSKTSEELPHFLTAATIMVVSVSASTTKGNMLTSDQLACVSEACKVALELDDIKQQILEYVESRMSFIAPNLSAIVGPSTAAKLLGVAGGLTNLSRMPACNVLLLGKTHKTLAGFSSANSQSSFIHTCDIVNRTPADLRKKAAKLLAAKSVLAARVDAFHESGDGSTGQLMRDDIDKKLEKLQEPPQVKMVKPLPVPLEGLRKKRGGRRHRKMKERMGLTEIRKEANRMNFAEVEDEAYQEDMGLSLGNLGKSGTGKIRGPTSDKKTEVKLSKSLQRKLARDQAFGGRTTVRQQISGTASSVVFTPVQGLEIINPQATERKIMQANNKYFSSTTGFVNVERKV